MKDLFFQSSSFDIHLHFDLLKKRSFFSVIFNNLCEYNILNRKERSSFKMKAKEELIKKVGKENTDKWIKLVQEMMVENEKAIS